jgi:hypothetical protein
MDDHVANTVDIAVLKEQIAGLREQQRSHAIASEQRSNEISDAVKGVHTELTGAIKEVQKDVTSLLASMNRGKGAWAMLVLMASAGGAVIIKLAGAVFTALKP